MNSDQQQAWARRKVEIIVSGIDSYYKEVKGAFFRNIDERYPIVQELLSSSYVNWERKTVLRACDQVLNSDWSFLRTERPPFKIAEWYWYYADQENSTSEDREGELLHLITQWCAKSPRHMNVQEAISWIRSKDCMNMVYAPDADDFDDEPRYNDFGDLITETGGIIEWVAFLNDGDADEGLDGHIEATEADGLPWWSERYDDEKFMTEDESEIGDNLKGDRANPTSNQKRWLSVWQEIQSAKLHYSEQIDFRIFELLFLRIGLVTQSVESIFITKESYKKALRYEAKLVNEMSDAALVKLMEEYV